jgi:hypothetical protein
MLPINRSPGIDTNETIRTSQHNDVACDALIPSPLKGKWQGRG